MTAQTAPYIHTDAHDHQLTIRPVHDLGREPYVWFEAQNLAFGGEVTNVWLTMQQAADVDRILGTEGEVTAGFTDHSGDMLTVQRADGYTTFEVTRRADEDDDHGSVRVVVLTARLAEVRAAVKATAERSEQLAAAPGPFGPFGDRHGPTPDESRFAVIDGRDALAFVLIRPADDDPDRVTVEASSRGMSKAAAAYTLRATADQFDQAARAEGDEPFPDRAAHAIELEQGQADALAEQPFVPRTERDYWQAIADALNAANRAGMPVGIDLDGTLTDHRMWSVVWDRDAKRWDVAGYEDDDQSPAAPEQPTAPRVLTSNEYSDAYSAAVSALGARSHNPGSEAVSAALDAALFVLGILAPPPTSEPDTCPAQFADSEGAWHQCAEDPDHDPADGHDNGEWAWPDGDTYARPEPDDDQAQQP
ncbi:hypothetical protein [Streptomyces sp. TP-A0875]|uniref:hypothetical protein n=1 Tax=Streptomyces sp. TP-A0875 TaxID=552354 RepID=UPI0006B63B49|nr:hypothetical protein [Streptomyces sp. TP-A0875]